MSNKAESIKDNYVEIEVAEAAVRLYHSEML
jgi:hypothetical protein